MIKKRVKTIQEREAIITEYLLGDITYRKLGKKHGVDFRTLHSWVSKFEGKSKRMQKPEKKSGNKTDLPTDVKQLQAELRKSRLHNELLNAMIDIAEKDLNISIRKKSGAKR